MAVITARRSALAALALALVASPSLLFSQATTGAVRGRVTDAAGGRGLPDAQVSVEGTRLGAVTGVNGDFTIVAVPTGTRTIVARRIGYSPVSKTVNVTTDGASTGDIALTGSALNLTEVVVTGSAAPTERRKLGTSIASIDSTTLTRAQTVTVDQALQGKVPGAQITQNSGGPGGGGISVRLRGTPSSPVPIRCTSWTA